jgi:hypothetical protein
MFVETFGVDRPEDPVSCAVDDTILERQGVDQPNFGKVLIERVDAFDNKILPYQMILSFDKLIFTVGRIGQHFRLQAFVTPGKQVSAIQILEVVKLFEESAVLFHIRPSVLLCVSARVTVADFTAHAFFCHY